MIVSWEKEVGDELAEGDILAQVRGQRSKVRSEKDSKSFSTTGGDRQGNDGYGDTRRGILG